MVSSGWMGDTFQVMPTSSISLSPTDILFIIMCAISAIPLVYGICHMIRLCARVLIGIHVHPSRPDFERGQIQGGEDFANYVDF